MVVALRTDDPNSVQLSTDGGKTFEGRAAPAAAAALDVTINPDNAKQWAVGTESGTFLSTNEGDSWRQRDTTSDGQGRLGRAGQALQRRPGRQDPPQRRRRQDLERGRRHDRRRPQGLRRRPGRQALRLPHRRQGQHVRGRRQDLDRPRRAALDKGPGPFNGKGSTLGRDGVSPRCVRPAAVVSGSGGCTRSCGCGRGWSRSGTLACPRCDAPVAPGGRALSPGEPIECPFCGERRARAGLPVARLPARAPRTWRSGSGRRRQAVAAVEVDRRRAGVDAHPDHERDPDQDADEAGTGSATRARRSGTAITIGERVGAARVEVADAEPGDREQRSRSPGDFGLTYAGW